MSCGVSYFLLSKMELTKQEKEQLEDQCLDTCTCCGETSFVLVNGCGLCEACTELFGFEKGRSEEYHWLLNEATEEESQNWLEKNVLKTDVDDTIDETDND